MNDILIVKIGSESLKDFQNAKKISTLIADIVMKIKTGVRVLLVTSGAVQFGREYSHDIENKQVLAAIGWHHLLSAYLERFKRYNIDIAGFLVTHADLEDDESRASTLVDTIKATWQAGILPIVNENDPISTEEMREVGRGADNDQNAFLLARIFDAHEIVIISNTDGAYRDHRDPNTRIDVLRSDQLNPGYISSLCEGKSGAGTGGMESKLKIAHEAGKSGIGVYICDGIHSGICDRSLGGTMIMPIKK